MKVLKHLIIPSGFFSFVRLMLSVLAILALVEKGTGQEFSSAFNIIISHYDEALRFLLEPIDPYVHGVVLRLSKLVGADLELFSHWRYALVLLSAFLSSRVIIAFGRRQYLTTIFRFFTGAVCIGASSIAIGVINLKSKSYASEFQIAFYPVLGLFIYHLLNSIWMILLGRGVVIGGRRVTPRWPAFLERLWINAKFTFFAAIFFLIALFIPAVRAAPAPGLILLAAYMLGAALFYLWTAWHEAQAVQIEKGAALPSYWQADNALVGIGILNIFLWSVIFAGIDVLLQMAHIAVGERAFSPSMRW